MTTPITPDECDFDLVERQYGRLPDNAPDEQAASAGASCQADPHLWDRDSAG